MGICQKPGQQPEEVKWNQKACEYAKASLPYRYPLQKEKHPVTCRTCPLFSRGSPEKKQLKSHKGFFNRFLSIVA